MGFAEEKVSDLSPPLFRCPECSAIELFLNEHPTGQENC